MLVCFNVRSEKFDSNYERNKFFRGLYGWKQTVKTEDAGGHEKEYTYERHGVLGELEEGAVEFELDEELRRQILAGHRTRRLQNISIKLDPAQIQALRKIATMKSIPYQTLVRQWLAEGIRKELHL